MARRLFFILLVFQGASFLAAVLKLLPDASSYYFSIAVFSLHICLFRLGAYPFDKEGKIVSHWSYGLGVVLATGAMNLTLGAHRTFWWYPTDSPLWGIAPAFAYAIILMLMGLKYERHSD